MIAMIKCFNKSFKKEDESNDGDQGKDKKQIKRLGNPTLIMVTAVWTGIEMSRDFFVKTSLTFFLPNNSSN